MGLEEEYLKGEMEVTVESDRIFAAEEIRDMYLEVE